MERVSVRKLTNKTNQPRTFGHCLLVIHMNFTRWTVPISYGASMILTPLHLFSAHTRSLQQTQHISRFLAKAPCQHSRPPESPDRPRHDATTPAGPYPRPAATPQPATRGHRSARRPAPGPPVMSAAATDPPARPPHSRPFLARQNTVSPSPPATPALAQAPPAVAAGIRRRRPDPTMPRGRPRLYRRLVNLNYGSRLSFNSEFSKWLGP